MSTQGRFARLRAALVERELDCLLVTDLGNVRYLAGFTGTNATLVIDNARAVLLTDFRYVTQASAQAEGFEIVDGGNEPRAGLVELLKDFDRIGFEDAQMRVKSHTQLVDAGLAAEQLVPASGLVEDLRSVKDQSELAAIAAAAELSDEIYSRLASEGLAGRTERAVAWRIEQLAHELGAEGLSFPSIVAAGAHGALPHAEPRDVEIAPGELVVLDLGVKLDGYCSDCTRTFASGELPEREREVYALVLEAQELALAGALAGAECRAVDAIARDVITAAGMGDRFGHSLGHGVGIEVHELPTLSARSEGELESGNVVTVEPGVYLDDEFGVRIEDLVVVTDGAPRVLTGFTKSLQVVG